MGVVLLLTLAAARCSGEIDDGDRGASGRPGGDGSGGSGASGAAGGKAGSGAGARAGSGGRGGSSGAGGRAGASGSAGSGAAAGSGGSPGCTPNYACRPTPPPATGDAHADCVARINQFRDCVCVPRLERWTEAESCANQQVAYDRARNDAHAGWTGNICSPKGSGQNECLGGAVNGCQQSMFDEGPPPQTPCEDACFQRHDHFINMTNRSFRRVACGFDGSWSVQNYQ